MQRCKTLVGSSEKLRILSRNQTIDEISKRDLPGIQACCGSPPSMVFESTAAPWLKSSCTMEPFPFSAARCSAVLPQPERHRCTSVRTLFMRSEGKKLVYVNTTVAQDRAPTVPGLVRKSVSVSIIHHDTVLQPQHVGCEKVGLASLAKLGIWKSSRHDVIWMAGSLQSTRAPCQIDPSSGCTRGPL